MGIYSHTPAPFPNGSLITFLEAMASSYFNNLEAPSQSCYQFMLGGFMASSEPDLMAQPYLNVLVLVWWTPR